MAETKAAEATAAGRVAEAARVAAKAEAEAKAERGRPAGNRVGTAHAALVGRGRRGVCHGPSASQPEGWRF